MRLPHPPIKADLLNFKNFDSLLNPKQERPFRIFREGRSCFVAHTKPELRVNLKVFLRSHFFTVCIIAISVPHIFGKDAITSCGVVDKHVSDRAYQFSVLDNR